MESHGPFGFVYSAYRDLDLFLAKHSCRHLRWEVRSVRRSDCIVWREDGEYVNFSTA